jgi:actin-related protein
MEDTEAIMIDIGSFNIKAGFSGEDAPKVILPTIIGMPKFPGILVGMDQKDFYVGYEAKSKKHLLNLSEPVKNGEILDFDHIEKILQELMNNELKTGLEDAKVMISEPPNNSKEMREKLCELMFEEFGVRCLYFAN